jgi:hypothetical protein
MFIISSENSIKIRLEIKHFGNWSHLTLTYLGNGKSYIYVQQMKWNVLKKRRNSSEDFD